MTFLAALLAVGAAQGANTPKFYPDDPLLKAPRPHSIKNPVKRRKLNDLFDLFLYTFANPAEKQTPAKPIRAMGTNTLDEVPDIPWWFENRHGSRPMTIPQLVLGPGGGNNAPSREGAWHVLSAKNQGVTPGFMVQDSKGRRYLIKFDPSTNPEMATAADVIGSRLFHALGYFVPENYLIRFDRQQLVVDPKTTFTDLDGKKRRMRESDVDTILRRIARDKSGRYRAVASLFLKGDLLGPFRYHGTRTDDPNDIFPHEHRRDLRGLFVFCAWLGHDDSRSINTLDTLVEEDGARFIRHDLIDFGSILGSASTKSNSARSGHEYLFAFKPSLKQFFTLGLYVPEWARVDYPHFPSVGKFHWSDFDPEKYRTEYPNPAFINRLPDDSFWAAKQVMRFTDDQIRAIVRMGQYSDRKAEDWVVECLIKRRDRIGQTYFKQVLPLDGFRINGRQLEFDDLAVKYGHIPNRRLNANWSVFDNLTRRRTAIASPAAFTIPESDAPFLAAEIWGDETAKNVVVYLRRTATGRDVVGIERNW
ncbi:MAG: hypothetical protein FJW40_21865 [Acidobacteria bacterium]|nr:hypothetical protein [Acidobacteriota bacterium]